MRSPPWHTPAKDYDYSTSKNSTTAWKPCYQRCYQQQPCHCLASGAWLIVLLAPCPLRTSPSQTLLPAPSPLVASLSYCFRPLRLHPPCLLRCLPSRLLFGFRHSLLPHSRLEHAHVYSAPLLLAPRGPLIPPLSLLEWPGHMERGHGYTDNATRAAPGLCTIRIGSFSAHGVCADTVNTTPLMVAPLVATRTALSAIETTHASEMPC